jgi:hypothetical protein
MTAKSHEFDILEGLNLLKRKRTAGEATLFNSTQWAMLRIPHSHLPPNLGGQIPAFRSPDFGAGGKRPPCHPPAVGRAAQARSGACGRPRTPATSAGLKFEAATPQFSPHFILDILKL